MWAGEARPGQPEASGRPAEAGRPASPPSPLRGGPWDLCLLVFVNCGQEGGGSFGSSVGVVAAKQKEKAGFVGRNTGRVGTTREKLWEEGHNRRPESRILLFLFLFLFSPSVRRREDQLCGEMLPEAHLLERLQTQVSTGSQGSRNNKAIK